jgi:hypothetical protein
MLRALQVLILVPLLVLSAAGPIRAQAVKHRQGRRDFPRAARLSEARVER